MSKYSWIFLFRTTPELSETEKAVLREVMPYVDNPGECRTVTKNKETWKVAQAVMPDLELISEYAELFNGQENGKQRKDKRPGLEAFTDEKLKVVYDSKATKEDLSTRQKDKLREKLGDKTDKAIDTALAFVARKGAAGLYTIGLWNYGELDNSGQALQQGYKWQPDPWDGDPEDNPNTGAIVKDGNDIIAPFNRAEYIEALGDDVVIDIETGDEISRARPIAPKPINQFAGFRPRNTDVMP